MPKLLHTIKIVNQNSLRQEIKIWGLDSDRPSVSFSYNPDFVQRIKTVERHKWHPEGKYWSFPNTDDTLKKILKVFDGEEVHIGSLLQTQPSYVIARGKTTKQSAFEDLRRELVSRKYSYKIVKSYNYYNRESVSFIGQEPSDINESDIKNYLLHLREEKQSATSTLNQAINALKFYYGTMLKKKFIYEVKRPRKDKKLPVVLSKEGVASILSYVDNIKHKTILMLIYSTGLRLGGVVKLKREDIDSKKNANSH